MKEKCIYGWIEKRAKRGGRVEKIWKCWKKNGWSWVREFSERDFSFETFQHFTPAGEEEGKVKPSESGGLHKAQKRLESAHDEWMRSSWSEKVAIKAMLMISRFLLFPAFQLPGQSHFTFSHTSQNFLICKKIITFQIKLSSCSTRFFPIFLWGVESARAILVFTISSVWHTAATECATHSRKVEDIYHRVDDEYQAEWERALKLLERISGWKQIQEMFPNVCVENSFVHFFLLHTHLSSSQFALSLFLRSP